MVRPKRPGATPPRRTPRQPRSRATADAIVEAAARVLADVGLARATTNRIAEVAGVSVGSLYQYFPSKEALLTALFERESEHLLAELGRHVERMGVGDVPALVRAFVEVNLRVFDERMALYRVLFEEVPRVAGLGLNHQVDARTALALRGILELGRDRLGARDLDVVAALVVRTFRYNTLAHLHEPLHGAKRDAFVDELTRMLASYLLAP